MSEIGLAITGLSTIVIVMLLFALAGKLNKQLETSQSRAENLYAVKQELLNESSTVYWVNLISEKAERALDHAEFEYHDGDLRYAAYFLAEARALLRLINAPKLRNRFNLINKTLATQWTVIMDREDPPKSDAESKEALLWMSVADTDFSTREDAPLFALD